jgi:HAD superfamily hydrolase (TIGR01509 family)
MRIRAVIFDIDGLMIDSERISQRSWGQVMADAGYPLSEEVYLQMIGRTEKDVRYILQRVYGEEFPFDEMYHRREERFNQIIAREGMPVKPGLITLLDFIDAKGMKKAVASSTYCRLAEMKLIAAGIRERFSVLVTGDEVAHGKPAPDLFLAAAARIETPPAECLVLEDSEAGLQAAHAAGMAPVWVPDMQPVAESVVGLAFRQVKSLDEVVGVLEEVI